MLEQLNPADEDLKIIKMLEKKLGIKKKKKNEEEEKEEEEKEKLKKKNDLKKYLEEKRKKKREEKEEEQQEKYMEEYDKMYEEFDSENDLDDGLDDLFKPYDDNELEDVKREILLKKGNKKFFDIDDNREEEEEEEGLTNEDIFGYINGAFAFNKVKDNQDEVVDEEVNVDDEEQEEDEEDEVDDEDEELSDNEEEEEDTKPTIPIKTTSTSTTKLGVYIPPSKRNLNTKETDESFILLKKQIKRFLNKLTADNLNSIFKEIIEIYETSIKNDFNEIFSNSILNSICDPINLKTEFILVYSALISGLNLICGNDFGSFFIEKTILHFDSLIKNNESKEEEEEEEERDIGLKSKSINLILLICYLFNFEVRRKRKKKF